MLNAKKAISSLVGDWRKPWAFVCIWDRARISRVVTFTWKNWAGAPGGKAWNRITPQATSKATVISCPGAGKTQVRVDVSYGQHPAVAPSRRSRVVPPGKP